jgi:tetratricopeptide (TPR) repeat protein
MEKALSLSKTLVFVGVGAGIKDPHFDELLTWLKKFNPNTNSRQYILLTEGEVKSLQIPEGLVAIPYGKEYSDLTEFLRGLKPFSRQKIKQDRGRRNRTVEQAIAKFDTGSNSDALHLLDQFSLDNMPQEYAWNIRLMSAKNLMRLNQFEKALSQGQACADFFYNRDTVQYISSQAVVNTVLRDTEKWLEAAAHADLMVTHAEEAGVVSARCSAYHSLARCQSLIKADDAINSALRSKKLAREPKEKGKASLALGEAYRHLGHYDKAKPQYAEAVEVAVRIGRQDLYIWSKLGLHDVQLLAGEFKAAEDTLNRVELAILGKEQSHPLEAMHVALCRKALLFTRSYYVGGEDDFIAAANSYDKFDIKWPSKYVSEMIAKKNIPYPKPF